MWRHRNLAKLLKEEFPSDVRAIVVRKSGQGPTDRPRKPQKTRLRGIFADADAIARRKVR